MADKMSAWMKGRVTSATSTNAEYHTKAFIWIYKYYSIQRVYTTIYRVKRAKVAANLL